MCPTGHKKVTATTSCIAALHILTVPDSRCRIRFMFIRLPHQVTTLLHSRNASFLVRVSRDINIPCTEPLKPTRGHAPSSTSPNQLDCQISVNMIANPANLVVNLDMKRQIMVFTHSLACLISTLSHHTDSIFLLLPFCLLPSPSTLLPPHLLSNNYSEQSSTQLLLTPFPLHMHLPLPS
jgi:hypothetical protein